ncbi:hypothetical protein PR048_020911 [Dryococelus australis]|uniref:Uncharacterized protein n=1 Tax=Dryococelus australis TaxID=614101 RepID=A0ABQ9GWR2_9NEOP|nr:hypothetical protein PR048_020911 [Dryococelus australis]
MEIALAFLNSPHPLHITDEICTCKILNVIPNVRLGLDYCISWFARNYLTDAVVARSYLPNDAYFGYIETYSRGKTIHVLEEW